ncbi:MAG: response regulator [Campylobacterota bacterium]|nr:response regulator [Campylobacterota bacterium]
MENTQLEDFVKTSRELTILYVEDNDIVRESTIDMLDALFATVDSARDGAEGLAKYEHYYSENNRYHDIILTDINMPKMNGIEMSRSILAINGEQIIIVISAHNESDYLLTLINMGISNFILKPIDVMQFQKIVFRIAGSINSKRVTEEHHKEMQIMNVDLKAAKEQAEEASRQKSLFLANMSHEIRTPLNAITGFISLLHEKESDPEKLKYLQVVRSSSESLLQVISDILDISKIENGKLEIDPINFQPYEDLITVAELFQEKATQKGVVLEIQYSKNMPKYLYSDLYRIKQILSNLLSNAVKFTPKGSSVKCTIWYEEGCLNIMVEDRGIGISKENQKYIFESFSQAEGSTSREYGGTGLGLTICTKLTDLLGGRMTLESQEGRGSIFALTVKMPIADPIKEKPKERLEVDKVLEGHILIVEDIEANRMFLGIVLDNANLTYDVAINGIEAIEKFKTEKYDLILMDENMPKLGGIATTKEILSMEREIGLTHTPIIALTANALKGDKERFLKAGMDDYLSKPIDPNSLLSTFRKYLVNL